MFLIFFFEKVNKIYLFKTIENYFLSKTMQTNKSYCNSDIGRVYYIGRFTNSMNT